MQTNPVPASPLPAPLQGADVWGQLTASANFCVQSKQQHSALLAAVRNVLGGALSHCKVSHGWEERVESEQGWHTKVNLCQGCTFVFRRKTPSFLRHLASAWGGSIFAGVPPFGITAPSVPSTKVLVSDSSYVNVSAH